MNDKLIEILERLSRESYEDINEDLSIEGYAQEILNAQEREGFEELLMQFAI